MKKIYVLALAFFMAGAFAACGESAPAQPSATAVPQAATPSPVPEQVPEFYTDISSSVNPYTGLPKTADYPQGVRGVAVMINNVQAALPQSGLNAADLMYEMVTESGITRLMAVYRDYSAMPTVGPVRSARDQHVQLMLPLDCLYAHIGGSTYAIEMLDRFKFTNIHSIDGKYKNYYWIDADRRATRAQEHCVYTSGEMFAAAVDKYELDKALGEEPSPVFNWNPADAPARELTGGDAQEMYVRFSGYADSQFVYDAQQGVYIKYEFGEPQLDMADGGKAYTADNVFVLFTHMEKYPDGVLVNVEMNQGAGIYFCNGRFERVRWKKGSGECALRILDNEGHETDVLVNPGRSYVAVVDDSQIENMRINGVTLEELGL